LLAAKDHVNVFIYDPTVPAGGGVDATAQPDELATVGGRGSPSPRA